MSDTPKDAKNIFLAALDIADAAERAAFVATACAGDEALRQRVEDLLRAYGQPDGPLEKLAAAVAPTELGEPIREQVGATIGPYKLMEQIGEGGFGLVFVAEQERPIRRKVALKIIKPGMDTRDVIARFEAERQALALMDHPNIARVLDAGTTQSGRPYFVMELVRGIPITEYCDQAQLTPRERLELFVPVCNAIQHAHLKGIIHRDVKPSNVLVTMHDARPVVKVIDFGVAKALHQQLTDRTIYTRFAQMIGTPLYMSPEQAQMSGLDIDTRSDIYSLGVLLYELLTGTTPFNKERLARAAYDELLKIIREEEPPKPSLRLSQSGDALPSIAAQRKTEPAKLSKMFSGDLDWIAMKALEKDRTRRYETANAFAADVLRYLNDEPVEASPPSAVYRMRKFARKHRKPVIALAAIATALLAGIAGTTWGLLRADAARRAAETAELGEREERIKADAARRDVERLGVEANRRRIEADTQRERAETALSQSEYRLYASQIAAANLEWNAGNPIAAWRHLDSCSPQLGGWEYRYLHSLFNRNQRTLVGHTGPVNQAIFSLDAKRIVSASDDGTIRIWDAETGTNLFTLDGSSGAIKSVALSADGRRIGSASDKGAIKVWDFATGRCEITINAEAKDCCSYPAPVVFSRDGKRIFGVDATGLRAWDALTGHIVESPNPARYPPGYTEGALATVTAFDLPVSLTRFDSEGLVTLKIRGGFTFTFPNESSSNVLLPVSICSNGKWIVISGNRGQLAVFDAATSRRVRTIDGLDETACICLSPDSRWTAIGTTGAKLGIIDLQSGRTQSVLNGHKAGLTSVVFSPDGCRLLSASNDQTIKLWTLPLESNRIPAPTLLGHHVFDLTPACAGDAIVAVPTRSGRSSDPTLIIGATPLHRPQMVKTGWVSRRAILSADARRMMVYQMDGAAASLWEPFSSGTRTAQWKARANRAINAIAANFEKGIVAWMENPRELGTGTITVWDSAKREQVAQLGGIGSVYEGCLAVSPDGATVAWGEASGKVHLWDFRAGKSRILSNLPQGIGRIVFRPDGSQLGVSDSGHKAITLIDAGSPLPPLTFRDYVGTINDFAFSPDGARLASAGDDGTVRIWDTRTGDQLLTLRGHKDKVQSVSFGPGGRYLISADPQELIVWDASGQGSEYRAVVQQLREQIADWNRVDSLFGSLLLKSDVLEGLKSDPTLSAQSRDLAIELATQRSDDPGQLNDASWKIVSQPNSHPEEYGRALRWAEAARRAAPTDFGIVNTLGVAQYRAKEYHKAITTLSQSNEYFSRGKEAGGPQAADLAFLAMAHQAVGHAAEAQAYFQQLAELVKQDKWKDNSEAQAFFKEAHERLSKKP
jgi:WD40 repeat protein/serine/threonine protein kinase